MATNQLPVFLDCDPGIDDAIAIAYLLCQPDVDLVGLAASGGNVSTAQVVRNAQGWLALAGRADIPVHVGVEFPLAHAQQHRTPTHAADAGAAGADGGATAGADGEVNGAANAQANGETDGAGVDGATGDPEYADVTHGDTGAGYAVLPEPAAPVSGITAAQAWVDAARAHPGELIGIVTGPSTNLALALELEPELPKLVKRLFVMGGAFNYRGNTKPTTEWNVDYDPEGAARAFAAFGAAYVAGEAPYPPLIGPIEATEMIEMTPDRLERILGTEQASPGWYAVLRELGEALRFYFEFHEADGHGYLAHIHDPSVVAVAVEWARLDRDRAAAAAHETTEHETTAHASTEHEPSIGNAPAAQRAEAGSTAPAPGSRPGTGSGTIPWAETALAPIDVELTGTLTRGETVADWLGRWNRPANAEIIRRFDAARVLDRLTDTLMRGPHHDTDR